MQRRIALVLGPLLFILVLVLKPFVGLSDQGHSVLGSTLWIAVWWVAEAIPIAATALPDLELKCTHTVLYATATSIFVTLPLH